MVNVSTFIILFEPIKLYERGRASIRSLYKQWNGGLDTHGASKQQASALSLNLLASVHKLAVNKLQEAMWH